LFIHVFTNYGMLIISFYLAPSSPRNVTVISVNATAVNITWSEPEFANGIIRNYTVQVFTIDDSLLLETNPVDIADSTEAIFGLTHNTYYTFNVTAVTVAKGDPGSVSFITRPCKLIDNMKTNMFGFFYLVPSLPLNITVSTGGVLRSLTVQWMQPVNPGGIITMYMITYNELTVNIGGNDTMIIITSLEPFSMYFIAITACTVDGCGNQTDFVIGTTEEEGMQYQYNY